MGWALRHHPTTDNSRRFAAAVGVKNPWVLLYPGLLLTSLRECCCQRRRSWSGIISVFPSRSTVSGTFSDGESLKRFCHFVSCIASPPLTPRLVALEQQR